jgi:CxxC motif-containing protein
MMKEQLKILCITCPKGCSLEVTRDGETIVEIKPGCKRGHEYVARELTDPRRMVATTVKVKRGNHPLLPVYTAAPFPKGKIPLLMQALRELELTPPITMGMVVVENILDSGIDILASRDMKLVG